MNPLRNRAKVVLVTIGTLILLAALVIGADLWRRTQWANRTMNEIAPRQARLQGMIEAKAQIETSLKTAQSTLAAIAYPANAGDANRVATDIQQRVRKLAETAEMRVTSAQVLPAKSAEGFEEITIMINADGAMEHIQNLLLALEQQTPRLLVENLEIRPQRTARRPQDSAVRTDTVTLRLNVTAVHLLP